MNPLRQPIENAQLNEVWVRVCFQLVLLDYRRNPSGYASYPPKAVLDLAEHYRSLGFTSIYWTMAGCARWLAHGYTLAAWRNEAPTVSGVRAFHKRHGRGARR